MEFIIGLLVGLIILYIIIKPKLNNIEQINQEIISKNEELKDENFSLLQEFNVLNIKKEEILNQIEQAENLFEKSYELTNERMDNATERMSQEFQKAQQEAEKEYLETLKDLVQTFNKEIEEKKLKISDCQSTLNELQNKVSAAVAASKRAVEMVKKQNFYRLNLSEEDLNEIAKLREVTPFLRNSEPLNKVIWKVYYEKPCNDMIGRVIGKGIHTGIYKITNIENNMCYIGQSVNLSDRFKQHIKRGLGAEPQTHNKLYPAMLTFGVENFTFEVVEECSKDLLNEREKFWQNFFQAKEFGYSIK